MQTDIDLNSKVEFDFVASNVVCSDVVGGCALVLRHASCTLWEQTWLWSFASSLHPACESWGAADLLSWLGSFGVWSLLCFRLSFVLLLPLSWEAQANCSALMTCWSGRSAHAIPLTLPLSLFLLLLSQQDISSQGNFKFLLQISTAWAGFQIDDTTLQKPLKAQQVWVSRCIVSHMDNYNTLPSCQLLGKPQHQHEKLSLAIHSLCRRMGGTECITKLSCLPGHFLWNHSLHQFSRFLKQSHIFFAILCWSPAALKLDLLHVQLDTCMDREDLVCLKRMGSDPNLTSTKGSETSYTACWLDGALSVWHLLSCLIP